MMSRRTQWIFVLASFFAVNGVLATVFLSQAGRPADDDTTIAVLGIAGDAPAAETPVGQADAAGSSTTQITSAPPSTVASNVAVDDVVAVDDLAAVETVIPLEEVVVVGDGEPADESEVVAEPRASAFSNVETPDGGTPVAHARVASIAAHSGPSADSSLLEAFTNPTARGGELVFQATGLTSTTGTIGVDQEEWIEVLLPVRPNGTKGWIKRNQVKVTVNPYRIDIDLSRHELVVYRYDEQRLATAIGVGKGGTPTPIGGFYLTELLRPSNPQGAYGPYAYGLSGYSDTLTSFNGGPGAIGIHGTNSPALLGTDVSHGCIRVANPIITKMAEFLPLGTPVKINR